MNSRAPQVDLETKIAFLEHTVDALNEVILEQGRSLDTLHRKLERLASRFESADAGGEEPVDPHEERPPHY